MVYLRVLFNMILSVPINSRKLFMTSSQSIRPYTIHCPSTRLNLKFLVYHNVCSYTSLINVTIKILRIINCCCRETVYWFTIQYIIPIGSIKNKKTQAYSLYMQLYIQVSVNNDGDNNKIIKKQLISRLVVIIKNRVPSPIPPSSSSSLSARPSCRAR